MNTTDKFASMFFNQDIFANKKLTNPKISSKLPKIDLIFPAELNLKIQDEGLIA